MSDADSELDYEIQLVPSHNPIRTAANTPLNLVDLLKAWRGPRATIITVSVVWCVNIVAHTIYTFIAQDVALQNIDIASWFLFFEFLAWQIIPYGYVVGIFYKSYADAPNRNAAIGMRIFTLVMTGISIVFFVGIVIITAIPPACSDTYVRACWCDKKVHPFCVDFIGRGVSAGWILLWVWHLLMIILLSTLCYTSESAIKWTESMSRVKAFIGAKMKKNSRPVSNSPMVALDPEPTTSSAETSTRRRVSRRREPEDTTSD